MYVSKNRINNAGVNTAMQSRLSLVLGFKMGANLKKITKDTILNPKKIALIIFNKCGLGLDYLTSELEEDELRPILLQFKRGKEFIMPQKRLKKIPKIIFEFTDLEVINLNGNQIKTIPKGIEKLVNLKHLFIAWNPIAKVNVGITKLKKLEYIDVQAANLKTEEQQKLNKLEGVKVNWELNPKNPYAEAPRMV